MKTFFRILGILILLTITFSAGYEIGYDDGQKPSALINTVENKLGLIQESQTSQAINNVKVKTENVISTIETKNKHAINKAENKPVPKKESKLKSAWDKLIGKGN